MLLTIELAFRLRNLTGTILPVGVEYENEELKTMAIRYNYLSYEMDKLDKRLSDMYNNIDLDEKI